jgi:nitrate/nitrite-specific signal transduction histidine kinase
MMMVIFLFYGLSFGGLGLAAYLQLRRGGDFPLRNLLPWLAAFGLACGATAWVEMFLAGNAAGEFYEILKFLRMLFQPLTGLLLLIFGWKMLRSIPLPPWAILIPGALIVPLAYVLAYASTTFITPSPIEIPIDIWSRYLLYLPGAILAGIGFLRQWRLQSRLGLPDISSLMLGAGMAFLFEAFVVGLVVPAAPYSPASYYNYDRVVHNAFVGEQAGAAQAYMFSTFLDYERVLEVTGLPIQFWRMISAFAVTYFVVRGLDVFDAIRKRELLELQSERDLAQAEAFQSQILARQSAERWTDALVNISRQIAELDDVDNILLYIVENARKLLEADFIGLGILNDDQSHLELKCFSNAENTAMVKNPTPVTNSLIFEATCKSRRLVSMESQAPDSIEGVCYFPPQPAQAIAVVCLFMDTTPIGSLWIARIEAEPFSETDLIWLECLADQVDIAIKHGLMTSQLQSLSIVEERGRIAREMHDGLAQILGYLNLQVQTLEVLLEQKQWSSLNEELKQMRRAVQTAHADVRENILSLRTTLANEKGLVIAIEEYLKEFGVQTNIDTNFYKELEGEIGLSSVAEVQLVCILQEALANVRKHAKATRVDVAIVKYAQFDNEYIRMTIKDDGEGFSTQESRHSFGLVTMRERAHGVHGEFHLNSRPGKGTLIDCRLPCVEQESPNRQSLIVQ